MSVKSLLRLNKCFSPVSHPFNTESEGGKTYGEWEFARGAAAVACYEKRFSAEEMFFGKDVLDVGCGEGGKTLYFLSLGAKSVTGIDAVSDYREKAAALAERLGFSGGYSFVTGDAASLPFDDCSFDVVTMNDFFEHAADPSKALSEAMRVLRPGGRLYINFPPYYHPYGAHLSDAINIPWVHMLYGEKTLIGAYEALTEPLPDRERRLSLKISQSADGEKHISYINKMTLKKAKKIIVDSGVRPIYRRFIPLRKWLYPASKLPLLREMFVKMAVYIFEKEENASNEKVSDKKEPALSVGGGDIHRADGNRHGL